LPDGQNALRAVDVAGLDDYCGLHDLQAERASGSGGTTVTTVGCGDSFPATTTAGRIIAVMLVGIGFVTIPTAAAAERFMRAHRNDGQPRFPG